MDISKLTEKDIRDLIERRTEPKNLDYKERFKWVKNNKDGMLNIVKDILAMANTQDGGKIIFGVRDSDYNFVGLSQEDYESFDQTEVNNFLQKYAEPKFACQVYKMVIDGKNVVVIDIPEFEVEPIICKKDAHSTDNPKEHILKEGQVFIRTDKGTTESIKSVEDMRDLLRRATVKKGEELLNSIKLLISGKPMKPTDESLKNYKAEIEEVNNFFDDKFGDRYKKYGYWNVISYPNIYIPDRILNKEEIRNLVESSEVRLRGWYFPYTNRNSASFFKKGRRSYINFEDHVEGYSAFKSGLFYWKGYFWKDIDEDKITDINFIDTIYSIMEFLLFIKRYFDKICLNEDDLFIEISLYGIKDRSLVSDHSSRQISGFYKTEETSIQSDINIKLFDLKTNYEDLVKRLVKDIFLYFNWEIPDDTIEHWQKRLHER